MNNDKVLIEARKLCKDFPLRGKKAVHAVNNVDLKIYEGETLALVGESGCGKSTLGRVLMQLKKPSSGQVFFKGQEISAMKSKEFCPYRRPLQLIFQDPYASLDPRMTVRDIIAEPLKTYRVCSSKQELTDTVVKLMSNVGIPADSLYRYPHQFSGGQRQRIGIARAIALNPSLVICDEPVSALDVSVQNQVLNLLKSLQKGFGLTYLFISHDLSVVRFISDRVCVMFLGNLCEIAPASELYSKPLHPYTGFLLDAIPKADPSQRNREKRLLSGELPSMIDPPSGCCFHTRCPYATDRCRQERPQMRCIGSRQVACHCAENFA
ncbi:MAG: ATP-binding cassette domain-containing protein [Oscillospiraceae bacterium]|nr:ATP-binding cassette domain-containing protein [Oscillospiraceae bacterium]